MLISRVREKGYPESRRQFRIGAEIAIVTTFLSSLPPLPPLPPASPPPPPSSLSACSLVATLVVFPPTSVTLARGADIKSNLAQWYALRRYIGYFADRCLLFLHGFLPRINRHRGYSPRSKSLASRDATFPSIRYSRDRVCFIRNDDVCFDGGKKRIDDE